MKNCLIPALALLAITLLSCNDDDAQPQTFYGESGKLGNGTARTFYRVDADNKPTAIGVAVSEEAIGSLPHGSDMVLQFPAQASALPFKHLYMGYMQAGHPPVKIYDLPHFDFHFYMIPNEERLKYTPETIPMMMKAPAKGTIPSTFFEEAAVPLMGMHWADGKSGEFNNQKFNKTFLYGSYDTKVIFYEPMITLEYLKATNETTDIIPLGAFPGSGMYPTKYTVSHNTAEKQYEVTLNTFVQR